MTPKDCPYRRAVAAAATLRLSIQNALGLRRPDPSLYGPAISLDTTSEAQLARLCQSDEQRGTILYLAYGSNLSIETFRGKRGIKPLAQINVQVPTLRLTFDLPGIPYQEPCFANSGRRDPEKDRPSEKSLFQHKNEYNKDKWHKGLVGVVYEVTPTDYAHIIATEGGGSGYQDILVDCYPFSNSDPTQSVPQDPDTKPFKAHTLFAPSLPDGERPPGGGRFSRPDQSYAQPSARYLKLIRDGASELSLPNEYQDYLKDIRPFTITTTKQRFGQIALTGVWIPVIMLIFGLGRIFADKNGILPQWLRRLSAAVFQAVWISYDNVFRPIFGEGERSIPDGGRPVPQKTPAHLQGLVRQPEKRLLA